MFVKTAYMMINDPQAEHFDPVQNVGGWLAADKGYQSNVCKVSLKRSCLYLELILILGRYRTTRVTSV